ncbi:MAG TPA: hypothetical protein VE987_00340, partial [Polyangiaceae bacterium]|nr:hypothetical protein [Polyangiaceae bacterium]
ISSQVGNALCAKCTTQADCDAFADSCKGGRCQRGMSCEQEIGAVGRLDVSSLLAKYSKGESAKMDILAVLGGYADVTPAPSPGLSLGMLGGAMGGPHNPCVPMRPAPETPMVGKWAAWSAETEPRDGMPFHVGIGVHQSHLDTVAWGAFDGGALCLNVGTGSVPQLDSSTVGLVIRSLQDLVHVRDAPMFLAVRPQQEPQITLGAGTFNVDANGMKTIKDPLLHVSIPKLSIDFYAFVDERYVRVMTLTADVTLPVALDVDGMGRIVPLLGDLSSAFGNVTVTNSELLAESPAKLAKTFPMLLAVAVSQFGLLPPVALPKVMGLGIKLVAIEPTNDDAGNPTFLSIFANLDTGNPEPFRATTQAEVAKVAAPPTEAFSVENGLPAEATPSVELRLGGRGRLGDARDLEWSWRIDDGLWSPWSQAQSPSVSDPRLWLQGRHAVEVKARIAGEPATEDPAPVRLEFLVDTVPPAGEFDIAGDELLVDAHDLVSPDSALEYAWRAPGGEWSAWTNEPRIRLPQAAPMLAPETLGVRVRDEAGNVGDAAFHGRTTATGSAASCACDLGGRGRDGGARTSLIALLLLGSALVRRRLLQRSRVVVHCSMLALLALAATAPGCGGSPGGATAMLGKGDLLNPADEIGRYASAVAAKGTIHVSAYDDAEGDLAYAEIDETKLEAPIEWQWIDGVPTGGPMDTPGGYRAGTTTPGDDVGLYTSIALTSTGETRIAYYDATHRALKLATVDADRKFHASFVEQPTAGSAGLYASLVLDGRDVPSIAYLATDIPDGAGGFLSKLRLATAKSPAPASPADWTFVDLDMSPFRAPACATRARRASPPTRWTRRRAPARRSTPRPARARARRPRRASPPPASRSSRR